MCKLSMIGLLLVLLAGCIKQEAPNQTERHLLLSATDFAADQAPPGGHYEKVISYAERSIDLSFRSADSDWFYLYSSVSLHASASDALMTGYAESFGASHALEGSGLQRRSLQLSPSLAPRASLELLLRDGQPVGNLFFAGLGRKSLFILFTGVYFDQAAEFEAFIEPKLALLRAFEYRDPLLAWAGEKLGLDPD